MLTSSCMSRYGWMIVSCRMSSRAIARYAANWCRLNACGGATSRPDCQAGGAARRKMRPSNSLEDRVRSGREDLNLRPPQPHCGALPGCATPRCAVTIAQPASHSQVADPRELGLARYRPIADACMWRCESLCHDWFLTYNSPMAYENAVRGPSGRADGRWERAIGDPG